MLWCLRRGRSSWENRINLNKTKWNAAYPFSVRIIHEMTQFLLNHSRLTIVCLKTRWKVTAICCCSTVNMLNNKIKDIKCKFWMSSDFLIVATMEKGEWKEKVEFQVIKLICESRCVEKEWLQLHSRLKINVVDSGLSWITFCTLFKGAKDSQKTKKDLKARRSFFFILFKFISTLFDIYIHTKAWNVSNFLNGTLGFQGHKTSSTCECLGRKYSLWSKTAPGQQ